MHDVSSVSEPLKKKRFKDRNKLLYLLPFVLTIQHCFDSQIITCTDVKNLNYLEIQVHIKYVVIIENLLLVLYIFFNVNNGFWDINK